MDFDEPKDVWLCANWECEHHYDKPIPDTAFVTAGLERNGRGDLA